MFISGTVQLTEETRERHARLVREARALPVLVVLLIAFLGPYVTPAWFLGVLITLTIAGYVWFLAWDAQRWLQAQDR